MAESTLVRDALLLPVPEDLGDVMAAAIINPGQSPIGALRVRAAMQPGETVLINGATGTTGQVAVQIAKYLGAGRVIVTGRNPAGLARLRELGADETITLASDDVAVQDALAAHVADGGIDIVLDYLSGSPTELVLATLAQHHQVAKPIRYVLAGGAADTHTKVATSVLGGTSLVLMGSGIGAVRVPDIVQSAKDALQIAASANLQMDLTEVPLADVEDAWNAGIDRSRTVFTV
jgi:NADPH:quinone reductase-like Zn-dependent oxidoreductase